jgi:sugar phosphate isomerase/epimerase
MKHTDFKKYTEDLGLEMIASHCNITNEFERKVTEAAAIGMQYLLCPWIGPQPTLDAYKRAAQQFNSCGEICKKHGLRFGYHNHDYSFKEQDGIFPQDIFINETDKSLVDFEMDVYWVVTAGQDPIHWIKKYPERFTLLHLKDRQKGVSINNKDASVVLGTGSIDIPNLIKTGKENDIRYLIVEQEQYVGTTPLEAAKANAGYLRSLLNLN